MGGRVAEEQVFGSKKVTSGAASDIEQATKLARAMVTRWGFSEAVGRVALGENQEEVFLGHSVARTQNISEETSRKIDHEVRRLVDEGYDEAQRILTENKDELEALAQGLLEFETLSGEEIKDLLKGKRPVREDPSDDSQSQPRTSAVPSTGAKPRPGKGGDTGLEPQPT
jgi:cell division protease FtsH